MKKVIEILGVIVTSMLLGFSIGWADSEGISLVADTPSTILTDEV